MLKRAQFSDFLGNDRLHLVAVHEVLRLLLGAHQIAFADLVGLLGVFDCAAGGAALLDRAGPLKVIDRNIPRLAAFATAGWLMPSAFAIWPCDNPWDITHNHCQRL